MLVVALGADYDLDATPGPRRGRQRVLLRRRRRAPARDASRRSRRATRSSASAARRSSARRRRASARCCCTTTSTERGVRDACEITFVIPFGRAGAAVARDLARRCSRRSPSATSRSIPGRRVTRARPGAQRRRPRRRQRAAVRPLPRRPEAPRAGRRHRERHDRERLRPGRLGARSQTRFPGVYAVGDVATAGVPKAGVFAEGAARVVAAGADRRSCSGGEPPGALRRARARATSSSARGRVGRVDVDFLSGPEPTGIYNEPSAALVAEKEHFGSSRRARWFGI